MSTSGSYGDTGPQVDYADDEDPADERPRNLLPRIVLGLTAVLVVLLVLLVVLLRPSSKQTSSQPTASTTQQPAGPLPLPLPNGWSAVATDEQTDCAAHSYGRVQQYLAATPCIGVRRLLAIASASGRSVVVASNAINFGSASTAAAYLKLVSADGTGNISDLLREGSRIPNAITALPDTAAFASRLSGSEVVVAEAAYSTGATLAGDAALKMLAATALGS